MEKKIHQFNKVDFLLEGNILTMKYENCTMDGRQGWELLFSGKPKYGGQDLGNGRENAEPKEKDANVVKSLPWTWILFTPK